MPGNEGFQHQIGRTLAGARRKEQTDLGDGRHAPKPLGAVRAGCGHDNAVGTERSGTGRAVLNIGAADVVKDLGEDLLGISAVLAQDALRPAKAGNRRSGHAPQIGNESRIVRVIRRRAVGIVADEVVALVVRAARHKWHTPDHSGDILIKDVALAGVAPLRPEDHAGGVEEGDVRRAAGGGEEEIRDFHIG